MAACHTPTARAQTEGGKEEAVKLLARKEQCHSSTCCITTWLAPPTRRGGMCAAHPPRPAPPSSHYRAAPAPCMATSPPGAAAGAALPLPLPATAPGGCSGWKGQDSGGSPGIPSRAARPTISSISITICKEGKNAKQVGAAGGGSEGAHQGRPWLGTRARRAWAGPQAKGGEAASSPPTQIRAPALHTSLNTLACTAGTCGAPRHHSTARHRAA